MCNIFCNLMRKWKDFIKFTQFTVINLFIRYYVQMTDIAARQFAHIICNVQIYILFISCLGMWEWNRNYEKNPSQLPLNKNKVQ